LPYAFHCFFLVACTADNQTQDDVNTTNKESDDYAREIAWDFVKETGWDDGVKEEWQSAKVTKTIADDDDHQFLVDTPTPKGAS
jgi:hypothetical protein